MNEISLDKDELFNSLPPEWPVDLLPQIQMEVQASRRKVVVLDDDPTGTQTVHGLPILTGWSVEQLSRELNNDFPAFYVLTNSRSLPEREAKALAQEIGSNLVKARHITGQDYVVVSRGDSTLRGHFPSEVEALTSGLKSTFDACLLVPFFLEGERYTAGDIHYVAVGNELIPVGQTEFAKDNAFGFCSSNLLEWVVEKGADRIKAEQVYSITLEDIRLGGPDRVKERLMGLTNQCVCVVNAVSMRDVQVFVLGLLAAEREGKKFLYRTSSSFVQVRAGLAPRELLTGADIDYSGPNGGLVIVGSYVPKTTKQLAHLLKDTDILGIEIGVEQLLDSSVETGGTIQIADEVNQILENGRDVVIYTSRTLVTGKDPATSLAIGNQVSAKLVEILKLVKVRPRFLIAKGGITSSDLATQGLNVKRAMIMGQILPGIPVWKLADESRYPGMTYVVFPGNVGNEYALAELVRSWKRKS